MDGTILTANENFLNALGYSLGEIQGRHHSMFVDACGTDGAAYRQFWANLQPRRVPGAEYRRIGKGGREVWIQASYNPILDLERQAVQGGQIRNRHHGPGDRPQEERKRAAACWSRSRRLPRR